MKRLLWLPTLAFTLALAACGGGGGSSVTPPPPTGGFTLSSLKGNYAFSMSGIDPNNSGAYFARTGSFVADGAGNISNGLEDAVDLSTGSSPVTFSGKYTVLSNGRGTIALTANSGGNLTWTMELQSNSQGLLVETDGNEASSGSFNLQNVNDFTAASVSGNYVFDFSGITLTGTNVTNISIIGDITANSGSITSVVIDTNDGNNGHVGPTSVSTGSFQLDPTYGATNGRGIATFAGYSYAFYIVDNTRIKFIEEDSSGGSSGDAVLQSGTIPTTNAAFTGSFVYLVGGASTLGADAAVARVAADGSGNVGSISYDENNDGTNGGDIHISQGSNISSATYAIDTTNAGSGRGTFKFTDSTTNATYSYVFYLVSPNSGVIQDVSSGIVADGTLLAQSGSPFTLSGLAANYVYNWNGINNSSLNEEDFIGQLTLASGSTNNITGVLDGTVIGNGGNSYADIGTQGTLTLASDSTTNNTLQIVAGSPLSVTYKSVAYVADTGTILVLGTDHGQVLAGIATRQSN